MRADPNPCAPAGRRGCGRRRRHTAGPTARSHAPACSTPSSRASSRRATTRPARTRSPAAGVTWGTIQHQFGRGSSSCSRSSAVARPRARRGDRRGRRRHLGAAPARRARCARRALRPTPTSRTSRSRSTSPRPQRVVEQARRSATVPSWRRHGVHCSSRRSARPRPTTSSCRARSSRCAALGANVIATAISGSEPVVRSAICSFAGSPAQSRERAASRACLSTDRPR